MTTRSVFLDRSSSCLSWWRVGWVFYIFVILALGTLPIIGTYPVSSHTADEPAHIAAGMELLDRGSFTYEQQHPPLARLAVAVGPYLWAHARMARVTSSMKASRSCTRVATMSRRCAPLG